MKRQTQIAMILKWLKRGWRITHKQAEQLCDCTRLAARIYDIKKLGFTVVTEMVCNRRTGSRFASYFLEKEEA